MLWSFSSKLASHSRQFWHCNCTEHTNLTSSFIIVQFFYAWLNCFTGLSLFDPLLLMSYNLVFTSMQPVSLGLVDRPLGANTCERYPALYARWSRQRAQLKFGAWALLGWLLNAFYHSAVIFYFTMFFFSEGVPLHLLLFYL